MSADPCAKPPPDLGHFRDMCMGKEECRVSTGSIPLDGCAWANDTNYVQIEYHCVEGKHTSAIFSIV